MQDHHYSTTWQRYLLGAGVVLVLALSMLMPDTSVGLTGIRLILFWSAHVFVALLILQTVQMGLTRVPAISALSPWLQVFSTALVGAILFTPVASGLDVLFGLDATTDDSSETLGERLTSEFTGFAGITTVVWVGLNASRLIAIEQPRDRATSHPAQNEPSIWDRVPTAIGRDLVAISAELHYTRVITTQGEALILFPFWARAEQLATNGSGMQIHRSHWAAFAHIQNIPRKGQGGICNTTTGHSFPVSRSRLKQLEIAFEGKV